MDNKFRYNTSVAPSCDENSLKRAAELIKNGELVAVPTETVYGLAANALDEEAVKSIFLAKGRPQDNPLIVHVCNIEMWKELVEKIPDDALKLASAFWPGPLTIILKKSQKVPMTTTGNLDTVAVRMPCQKDTLRLIEISGLPLAAPSANISGYPSTTLAEHCLSDLGGKIPLILDGGACSVGIESTVLSLVNDPIVLRPGRISAGEISNVIGKEVKISQSVTAPLPKGEKAASPGMKYKHYSPKAKVILFEGDIYKFLNELEKAPPKTLGLVFEGEEKLTSVPCIAYGREHDAKSQSQGIFAALRLVDEKNAELVYARCPDRNDSALGVFNRMLRAAAFEVKRL